MNSSPKGGVNLNGPEGHKDFSGKTQVLRDGPMSYQLVGEVMAHQGSDG